MLLTIADTSAVGVPLCSVCHEGGKGEELILDVVITGRIFTYAEVEWQLVNSRTDRSYLVYCEYSSSLRTYFAVYYLSTIVVSLSTLVYIINSLLEIG